MKSLILTYHGVSRYASRTGRDPHSCALELISALRNQSAEVSHAMAKEQGFNIARKFKGDTYYVWFDAKINDTLLAIITEDGAIKTILRKEIYGYLNPSLKERESIYGTGKEYSYGYQSKTIKSKRRNALSKMRAKHKRN